MRDSLAAGNRSGGGRGSGSTCARRRHSSVHAILIPACISKPGPVGRCRLSAAEKRLGVHRQRTWQSRGSFD